MCGTTPTKISSLKLDSPALEISPQRTNDSLEANIGAEALPMCVRLKVQPIAEP